MMAHALRLVYLVLVIAPVAVIIGATIPAIISDPGILNLLLPSGRRFDLLIHSLTLASLTALITTGFGFLVALALTTGRLSRWPSLRWFSLVLAALPPYVHVLVWTQALAWLTTTVSQQPLQPPPLQGLAIAVWVEIMAWLPLATALALIALVMLPRETIETARTYRRDFAVLTRIVLPLAAPMLMGAGCLIFVLALTNYEVPSLFSITTYSLEIFAEFSTSHEVARVALIAVPLLTIASIALAGMLMVIRRYSRISSQLNSGFGAIEWEWPPALNTTLIIALFVLAAQIFAPFLILILGSGSIHSVATSVAEARPEIIFSLIVAISAAMLAPPLAHAVSRRLDSAHILWWALAILPIVVPAPLVGIGMLKLVNAWAPLWLLDSLTLPIAVAVARFTPFAILVFSAGLGSQNSDDRDSIDAVRVFQPNPLKGWLKIRLRLMAPSYFAAAGLVFALSLGELSATLLVAPPGRSSLAIRIYNYLHYGASESVHGLCLAILTMTTMATFFVVRFINHQTRRATS